MRPESLPNMGSTFALGGYPAAGLFVGKKNGPAPKQVLPTQPEKSADQMTQAELLDQVKSLMPKVARRGQSKTAGKKHALLLTDLENGARFAKDHGLDVRYYKVDKKWWQWDGKRWARDETGRMDRLAKATAKRIVKDCWDAGIDPDAPEDKGRVRQLMEMQSMRRIESMVKAAQTEEEMVVTPAQFDTHPWLLNVKNGVIDLKTGELSKHKRDQYITKLCPVTHDKKAECPKFLAFLKQIMDGDEEMVGFLQRIFGYALTGDTREQCFFLLHGQGRNGKSTLLGVIGHILSEYAVNTPTNTLLSRGSGSEMISNDLARLKGARLVTAVEAEVNRHLAESLIKQMTGGDKVTARFLWGEYFDFFPEFKLIIAANHKPNITGQDLAIWRRIHLIPFDVTIAEDQVDRDLQASLKAEASGILNWMLAGCQEWRRAGLQVPQKVKDATETYKGDQDIVGEFLAAGNYVLDPAGSVTSAELYTAYKAWADEQGDRPLNRRELAIKLSDKGFKADRAKGGVRLWRGLKAWEIERGADGDLWKPK
jgi:putative DNA primase/helicase